MWNVLRNHLHNYDVHTLQNPSSANVPPSQLGDLYDDARAMREKVLSIDGPVVVVAHSYGGAPATEGLAGLGDKVKRILYLHAFMPDVGESLVTANRGLDWWWGTNIVDQGAYEMLHAERIFYSDFEPMAAEMAAADLTPHSVKSFEQPITKAAWREIPSSYVIGEQDHAVPKEAREFMATRAQHIYRVDSGHSSFISQPDRIARFIHEEYLRLDA
ncbi:alpha/beta hydrolase [Actinoplanes sp. TBRC 11911]|nr:alpha/beta hydrolase [Actinoplanes sp. TBRC 11911]